MPLNDLTQGPVAASLFKLTAPMMVGVSSHILVSMLEIGFIGQLGTRSLAAVTFTFPAVMILSSIALGIGIGTSSVVARSVGAGNREDAQRLGTHSILLSAMAMSTLSLIGWLTIDPLFTALGADHNTLPLIHDYLDIYYPNVVLFAASMMIGNVMRASGNANIPGVLMTLGAIGNLALDPLLIFGWFGFPRLELAGAAVAAVIANACTAAALFYFLVRQGLTVTHAIGHRFGASCRRILAVGIPAMATQLIGPVSAAFITRMLASHGEAVVAGFGVATRVEAVAVMLLFALSGSIGPFVGQNWGANRPDRVRDGMAATYTFCMLWGVVAALPLLAFGNSVAAWVDDKPEVIAAAAFYLSVVPWSYGLWGVLMMSSASFNALGKPIPSTILSFTRMFIVYLPLAVLLDNALGYTGIFVATATSNAFMGLMGYLWFKRAILSRAR